MHKRYSQILQIRLKKSSVKKTKKLLLQTIIGELTTETIGTKINNVTIIMYMYNLNVYTCTCYITRAVVNIFSWLPLYHNKTRQRLMKYSCCIVKKDLFPCNRKTRGLHSCEVISYLVTPICLRNAENIRQLCISSQQQLQTSCHGQAC